MPVNTNLTNVTGDFVPTSGGTMTGNLTLNDDVVGLFGTGGTVSILYETADANANALIFVAPEGGGTDVPVFIFGDATILNYDLGWFNGVTEPTLALVNDVKDAYISIDAGDDAVSTSKGIFFKAAADEDIELVNLSVTGTPRIFWDESEDAFSFYNISIGANKLKTTNIVLKEGAATRFDVRNAADSAFLDLGVLSVEFNNAIYPATSNGLKIRTTGANNSDIIFDAMDNDVGTVEVARLQGAADPYIQLKHCRLNPIATTSLPAAPVEGMFYYDDTANKLKFYNGTAWETVTSSV